MPKVTFFTSYYPNYRLGPIDGSSCDTLGIDNHPLCGWRYDITDTAALQVDFTDNSFYEPATWHWDFGDGTTSQDTSPVHIFPAPGVYYVCLTVCNQYSCDTLCQYVYIGVDAVEAPKPLDQVLLFPNPAGDNLFVSLPVFTGLESLQLTLTNPLGQTVLSQAFTGGQVEVDVSGLPAGLMYVQVLERGKIRAVGKVMVLH